MRLEQGAAASLVRRQAATVILLFAGYAGYYLCRANLSVAAPLLIADLHSHGKSVNEATLDIGSIASLGTLAYAFGKFFLTWSGDVLGGKRSFLLGMLGAVAFTTFFAGGSGLPIFMTAWAGNRLFQSIGWAGLVKVTSKWFAYSSYGSVMAILSLSFLAGDAVARGGMGALVGAGFGWRAIFLIAGGSLALIFLVNVLLLRESSADAGFPVPAVNPLNVFGDAGTQTRPRSLPALLQPLLRSRAFLIVCALSFGTTLLREALGTWTPTFFASAAGFSVARAAAYSALSPAAGVLSVLAAGWLSDRLGPSGRARISFVGLALAACALCALGLLPKGLGLPAVALVVAVALFSTGPYSYLAGAMALDFGGRTASAFASGIIDGVGYIGGALAGVGIARLVLAFGWSGAFFALGALIAATALCAAALVFLTTVPRTRDRLQH
jgi:OPA family glycerol-3-phosphate transporter-like MFS transporter